jgi:hypothetical protein
MNVKLKIGEMFAISQIVDKHEIIGYKAALMKLYYKMLDIKEFSEIISLFEEIKINQKNIYKKYLSDIENSQNENNKKELIKKCQDEIELSNKTLIEKINDMLSCQENEYEFEFNNLLLKSIFYIVESEKTFSELNIEKAVMDTLIQLYLRLNK